MSDPYRYTRKDVRLRIITEAITALIPRAVPSNISVEVVETLPGQLTGPDTPGRNTWSGRPDAVAERIFTALFGRPDKPLPTSPASQADDAKRRRDLVGEVDAVQNGCNSLERAPWYPARAGDLVHVAYETAGQMPAYGETYAVVPDPDSGNELQLKLLHHTCDDETSPGWFAPGVVGDPLTEPWMEAGPHRLTVIRDGAVVHPVTR
ncbi:hypothetical protein [Streptomyces sp. NBC_01262]|uniref:hypothetical protein n=1 Tax=Streptomyces sp. NBC_01262 TaxID=2903803 RepID=UPI002E318A66|nr:hypothetical protein [Streptomyces sp. NBC_01262]